MRNDKAIAGRTDDQYRKNARLYRVLANPKRLKILNLLIDGEMQVEELAKFIKIPLPNLSQHLFVLKQNHLVSFRKSGKKVYYKLLDKKIVEPCNILDKLE
ncbi:metalloregulator ArsR/SmtB family transcription factor [Candidatus Microgenomates bacterium]|nr:metalloregulator ArsR/SmtB family transcription factor [Candidatus Microgenomates bacterium]